MMTECARQDVRICLGRPREAKKALRRIFDLHGVFVERESKSLLEYDDDVDEISSWGDEDGIDIEESAPGKLAAAMSGDDEIGADVCLLMCLRRGMFQVVPALPVGTSIYVMTDGSQDVSLAFSGKRPSGYDKLL